MLPTIRRPRVPWGDILQSDLEGMGAPELARNVARQRHLCLHVRGEYVQVLGVLAVRCERKGETLIPISMAIADTTAVIWTNRPNAEEDEP